MGVLKTGGGSATRSTRETLVMGGTPTPPVPEPRTIGSKPGSFLHHQTAGPVLRHHQTLVMGVLKTALKAYRKPKRLCFKCGEQWCHSQVFHHCASTLSVRDVGISHEGRRE